MKTNITVPMITLHDESDSGDISSIISELTGKERTQIEEMLQTGITPWELARHLGVLGALRDTLLERVFTNLGAMVQSGQISQEYADELIACFEMTIPAEDSK